MIDVIAWLAVAELLSLAALPLTLWVFQALPDRGFAFSKLIGLLLTAWVAWWIGFPTGFGGSLLVLWPVLITGGIASWAILGRSSLAGWREWVRPALVEEALFVVAFVVWAVVRSLHPDIAFTEKPMDLMFLQSAGHVSISPPQDLWLAGYGANYYYFGYLLMATMGKLAGSPATITFNLALAFIFAVAIAGSYSIVYNLTKSGLGAMFGPLFVVLSGNAAALFDQVLHGQFPWNQSGWYFQSSRVVGAGTRILVNGVVTPVDATINEFPMFSLVLGDLHPHVMAIPVALASLTCALSVALGGKKASGTWPIHPGRLIIFGIVVGSLFATNTWDFPTYLFVCIAALGFLAWRTANGQERAWQLQALLASGVLVAACVLAFLPYVIEYRSPASGIGIVTTVTDLGQFAQVFGIFLVLGLAFALVRGWRAGLFTPLLESLRERGAATRLSQADLITLGLLVVVAITMAILHRWVLLIVGGIFALTVWLMTKGYKHAGEESSPATTDHFTLLLVAAGTLMLAVTELVYLRDNFDGGVFYRMNTVFKFYYQAWILLGLAAAYASWRVMGLLHFDRQPAVGIPAVNTSVGSLTGQETSEGDVIHGAGPALRKLNGMKVGWAVMVMVAVGIGLVYPVLGPLSYYGDMDGSTAIVLQSHGLDGMSWMKSTDPFDGEAPAGALDGDYQAIQWIRSHISGTPTILEATGGEYVTDFGRVSIFTGLPTLLGWLGHEQQWRGYISLLNQRQALVGAIYTTLSPATARRLLTSAHVSLVYVGPCERQVYANGPPVCDSSRAPTTPTPGRSALTKFAEFMNTIYSHDGVTIYRLR